MRLIFIGDFSGLSLFLSRGVAASGMESLLFSNGDGWKDIPRTNQLWKVAGGALQRAWNQIQGARSLGASLRSTDTLILSTEFLFNRWFDAPMLRSMMGKVGRTVLLHAGCSDGFHRLHADQLLCRNCKQFDLGSETCVFDDRRWPGLRAVLSKADLIVPFTDIYVGSASMYGIDSSRVSKPLQFPVDFAYLQGFVRTLQPKTGVIHGQNRPGFKGTAYLRELMNQRYSLQQLIELLPRMFFAEFTDRVASAQVVLDQLFGNGYGMTGCITLATGTAVAFGHTAPQPFPGFSGPGCLPIKITGKVDLDAVEIETVLHQYLESPVGATEIIDATRARHDHVMIATEFLRLLK